MELNDTMKGVESKQLVECMICGVLVGSVFSYHKHNVRQHSLAQLSRAILKLRNLKLPLVDPGEENATDEGDDDEDEDVMSGGINDPMDVLKLPVKVEVMDEVIELGPTDNSDHLQVQSRLLNSSDEASQHSSHVIEVKENHPPPCLFNPVVEDPNAITVKFNKELVTARDNSSSSVLFPEARKKGKEGNTKVLRATFKSTIEIPNPNSFIMDYKKAMSHSSEKYVMQNIDRLAPVVKKKRGRPRKNPENSRSNDTRVPAKGEAIRNEANDEEDGAFVGDPPLFSDEEDEEDNSVAVPSITKTRSGRKVKIKKEDGTFSYYDMPGRPHLEAEDMNTSKHEEEEYGSMKKSKRGRKRKILLESDKVTIESSSNTASCSYDESHNMKTNVKKEFCVEVSEKDSQTKDDTGNENMVTRENREEETIQNVNISDTDKKTDDSGGGGTTATVNSLNESFCFLCLKVFSVKEDCEKHMCEHISRVTSVNSENTHDNEHQGNSDEEMTEIITLSSKDLEASELEESPDKTSVSSLTAGDSGIKNEESLVCAVCNNVFESQVSFNNHSHDNVHDCKICGKKYQNRVNLQSHIKKYHEETEWMKFRCATCGKSFGFLLALERHMKEHNPNQKFCCDQCGKVFKSLTNLKNHIPLHTKDEVFRCPYCPKYYYIRYSYEKHVRSHVSPPKFHCEICSRNFNDKKYFEVHLERHQKGGCLGRSKDFRCNNCGDIKTPAELEIVSEADPGHHKTCLVCGKGHYKKFMLENVDPVTLQEKGEREREQCKLCGKFVINLLRHVRSTHLENSYVPCDVCGIVVSKASLPSHKNRKHGGSAVTCDHCNKVFKNIMCLREHMTKVRKKEDPSRNICKFCRELVPPELWKEHMAKHKMKCSECGASEFRNHDEFMAHLEACRRCSSCGAVDFATREEYLAHVEMCGSSIDIMTGTLDAASDQEVVTSIFAIVDDSTCCGTCGEDFEDQLSLANHITEVHPDALPIDHTLEEAGSGGDTLYACPHEACGIIFMSKELLSDHLSSDHHT
ncbi:zinc finger protein 699-like isoform X1 [Scylla paramamosain]|uniref:zinc finger protein 699-like isoform X1 n=2 Tax=Scylla paramamosain TaxID=85552 RepID=UPI0030839306